MKLKEKSKKLVNNQNGITLIALVVTIVVLLILAAISINLILGDNGIIGKANDAKNRWEQAEQNDAEALKTLTDELSEMLSEVQGGTQKLQDLVGKKASETENVTAQDEYGNKVVIPAGFTVVSDGTDGVEYKYEKDAGGNSTGNPVVQDGIVIKDSEGNQFVWVPVGTIKNDAVENTTNTTTITLGRYTFASDGTPTLKQDALNYTNETDEVAISSYKELATSTYENTIALDLGEWISKAQSNGGYYIGRYEASYGGTDSQGNHIPLSKVSTHNTPTGLTKSNSTIGYLWNFITQPDAATAARNMYPRVDEDTKAYSDLVNSYAWDTAIVFIQEYSGDSDYSRQNSFNTNLTNTGTTGDKVCNIYDMASNTLEWTTETYASSYYPCTYRGGYYNASSSFCPSGRYRKGTSDYNSFVSFRSTLCIK